MPAWARGKELMGQLMAQLAVDPDQIFQQRQRTCALDDVFSAPGVSDDKELPAGIVVLSCIQTARVH